MTAPLERLRNKGTAFRNDQFEWHSSRKAALWIHSLCTLDAFPIRSGYTPQVSLSGSGTVKGT